MAQAHADAEKYYVPHSSPWPIYGSITLFVLMSGAVAALNDWLPVWALLPGFVMLALLFIFWFHTVIAENQKGMYNLAVDRSFRMGMMWFIFSEVMFFAAFFGALFYARNLAVPWLSGEGVKVFTRLLLWNNYDGAWPTNGPAALGPRANGTFETVPALGLPAVNTAILLASSVTVTIAHHA
jgi:cytochrome c oxidase subunit III